MSVRLGGLVRGGVDDVRTVAKGWRWGRRPLVPRSAEPFVDDCEAGVFPTAWARRRSTRAVRELAQRAVLEPVFRARVRVQAEGLDVLEGMRGPVLFVANHASHLDTPVILLSLPDEWRRRTAVAAAADYFFDTWSRAVGSALVFNTFPIERRGGALASTPRELLADGWNVVVYPEGTRSMDGWMGKFRMGAAWLSIENKVPVIPVAHRGTFAAMPRGQGWPKPGSRVTVRFGPALYPTADDTPRDFAPRIRSAVAALLDEDASTWWAARRRAAQGTTPDPAGPETAGWRRVWEQTAPPSTSPRLLLAGERPRGYAAWRRRPAAPPARTS